MDNFEILLISRIISTVCGLLIFLWILCSPDVVGQKRGIGFWYTKMVYQKSKNSWKAKIWLLSGVFLILTMSFCLIFEIWLG